MSLNIYIEPFMTFNRAPLTLMAKCKWELIMRSMTLIRKVANVQSDVSTLGQTEFMFCLNYTPEHFNTPSDKPMLFSASLFID